ncbi:hypothetical protein L228DRAFT_258320 [Xylona heveae TC161]|uniref:Uncharacterized protein n=1 Tax=Xylona heveae (strain CBS 132557 / TC161) TaxID=1328760 RepID=A0A165K4D4_XYLHT|nr:hypothetical protein L228DRAFT_258320 [Xylona heveae TC161]KZF26969.1 hypothetical protein L228DRAFT_258320 [Xylona heveae TC161]
MSILFYRRPNYVARPTGPLNQADCQKYVERTRNNKNAIPPELCFERIISNKAMPEKPCSLEDFMDYLIYIEHDAENLQFYLWLQDYTRRFNATKVAEKVLSPEWKSNELPLPPSNTSDAGAMRPDHSAFLELTDIPRTSKVSIADHQSIVSSTIFTVKSHSEQALGAHSQTGLKWEPFTVQPFRAEIGKVISHYLAPGSPRELNLSHRDRNAILHALQHTTHPSAFTIVANIVELTLRGQSHPNFIRWSICNGNKPRVIFVRTVGISNVLLGFLIAGSLSLSRLSRWYRLCASLAWFVGFSILIAAYKGLCVIMHKARVRNLKPWEQDEEDSTYPHDQALSISDLERPETMKSRRARSMDSFGTTNTFSDDSWVSKYKHKSLFRKVFDRTVWMQDDALRLLQEKIVLQSNLWALIVTLPLTALFVALPAGGLF